jgi:hypothetical protein
MGLFDRWRNKKKQKPQKENEIAQPKKKSDKTAKELATERGEPYVSILSLELDPENIHQGAFELDWNEKFVADLVRAGYMIKKEDTDVEIVDRWFQQVCRNVALETYEQVEAMNPQRFTRSKDLGDGRREVS